ncbi:MAG: Rab family GTPase, partial [Promethearchaeota archaeon]
AAIGVYDITTPESLLRLPGWISTLKKAAGEIPLVLIGNKVDLEETDRRVARSDAQELADRLNAVHLETSAKDGTNVEEMFMQVARKCYERALEIEKELEGIE